METRRNKVGDVDSPESSRGNFRASELSSDLELKCRKNLFLSMRTESLGSKLVSELDFLLLWVHLFSFSVKLRLNEKLTDKFPWQYHPLFYLLYCTLKDTKASWILFSSPSLCHLTSLNESFDDGDLGRNVAGRASQILVSFFTMSTGSPVLRRTKMKSINSYVRLNRNCNH